MKTIKSFLVLVLIISPMLSCEETDMLDELLGKDIDVPISFVIDIERLSVPEDKNEDADNSFSDIYTYSFSRNPDVADVIHSDEQVKKIVLNSVRYEYRNFSGNVDAIVSGEIVFWGREYNQVDKSFTTQPVNVAEAYLTGELFNLQDAQGASIPFDNDVDVTIEYKGTSTANPLIFDIRLTVKATVTVEIRPSDL